MINTDYRWTTTQAIEDGACSGAYSLSGIVAFLVGYNSGLAPQVQSGSVMSAQPRMCQVPGPSADDLAGMDALYGPWIGIACTAPDVEPGQQEIPGVVPFDITCHVVADGERHGEGVKYDVAHIHHLTGMSVESLQRLETTARLFLFHSQMAN